MAIPGTQSWWQQRGGQGGQGSAGSSVLSAPNTSPILGTPTAPGGGGGPTQDYWSDPGADWWRQPGADYYITQYPEIFGDLPMPDWFSNAGYSDDLGGRVALASDMASADPGRALAQRFAAQGTINDARADDQAAIDYGNQVYRDWLYGEGGTPDNPLENSYWGRTEKGIARLEDILAQWQNSPTQARLERMSDPNYQALTDEMRVSQLGKSARQIARDQSNAIAAAVQQSGRRSPYAGAGLGVGQQTAARFRGAHTLADTSATLKQNQEIYNDTVRRWAHGKLSEREKTEIAIQSGIAQLEGRVPPINPLASIVMGIQSDMDVLYIDPNAVALTGGTEEIAAIYETAAEELGMSVDELSTSVDRFLELANEENLTSDDIEELAGLMDIASIVFDILGLGFQGATMG